MKTRTYIGLGSNLNNPIQQIYTAVEALKHISLTEFIIVSSLYRNPPLGPPQPDYINAVAALDTSLPAEQLLEQLQAIEAQQGRMRSGKQWGEPRTLDLDLLLYGDTHIQTDKLIIPHPGLKQRNFVLYPLVEIAPHLQLPDGTSLTSLLATQLPPELERL